jgi:hypothetical protein
MQPDGITLTLIAVKEIGPQQLMKSKNQTSRIITESGLKSGNSDGSIFLSPRSGFVQKKSSQFKNSCAFFDRLILGVRY